LVLCALLHGVLALQLCELLAQARHLPFKQVNVLCGL
jgi:hypothetical protein